MTKQEYFAALAALDANDIAGKNAIIQARLETQKVELAESKARMLAASADYDARQAAFAAQMAARKAARQAGA